MLASKIPIIDISFVIVVTFKNNLCFYYMQTDRKAKITQCAHCRLSVDSQGGGFISGESWFCCRGCEAVFKLLDNLDLKRFYDLQSDGAGVSAAELKESDLQIFDSAEFLSRSVVTNGGRSRMTVGILEMHCPACVWLLEKLPSLNLDIKSAQVNFSTKELSLIFDSASLTPKEAAKEISRLGYTPIPVSENKEHAAARTIRDLYVRLAVAAFGAMNTMMLSVSLYQGQVTGIEPEYRRLLEYGSLVLSLPVVFYSALPFYRRSIQGLVNGVVHIDLPLSIGIVVGFAASVAALFSGSAAAYFDTICMLICLLLIGQVLQGEILRRIRYGADAEWALLPQFARTPSGMVAIDKIRPGDRILVADGEIVPVDGEVIGGRSSINKSVITGESLPEAVTVGSSLVGGAVNYGAQIEMQATKSAEASSLSLIEGAVRGAARSSYSRMIDKISKRFVVVVLGAAVMTFLGWWILERDLRQAVLSAVALLVVTCPCAIGLAVPLAIRVGLARARARGILVKDEAALEAISKVRRVFFDKTGTLTRPQLSVSEEWRAFGVASGQVASLVLSLERDVKNHPVADSLKSFARGVLSQELSVGMEAEMEVEYRPGVGVFGAGAGDQYSISALQEAELEPEVISIYASILAAGRSPLAVRKADKILAIFSVGSDLKTAAVAVVSELRALQREVHILSGDSAAAVSSVAKSLKIDEGSTQAAVSPIQKAQQLREDCMMVGDGVNDLLALKRAGVGVAISGGVAASMAVASVFLRSGELQDVSVLVRGADDIMKVVRLNLGFSLVYNIAVGAAAILGYVNPFVAAILMPISSITVISLSNFNRAFLR